MNNRNESVGIKIASYLLEIEAVFLRPKELFTWASGIKSPIYCDNRLTLSFPEIRKEIENSLFGILKEKFPQCEAIVGTSTAGIPHASIIAHMSNLPLAYVRNFEKQHGRRNKIEGKIKEGTKTVVIEDLISTGGSAIFTANALKENNIDVLGILSIFTYDLESSKINFKNNDLINYSLTDYDTLIKLAYDLNKIDKSDLELLISFKKSLNSLSKNE